MTIRWLMLHKKCKDKKYSEIIEDPKNKVAKEKDIVRLLLLLSKFELQLKEIFSNLVNQKTQIWADDKMKAFENMNEIAEYFAGNRNWGKGSVDENYAAWFKNVTSILESLDFKHSTKTGRKIQQLIQALEDVQVYE